MNGWRNLLVKLYKLTVFNNSPKNKPKKKARNSKEEQIGSNVEVYYNNINGLLTKQDSLCHILQMKQPDVVTLCETKLHKNSQFDIVGYKVFKSNLKAGKEGILVAVKEGTCESAEVIYESDRRNIATIEITYPEDILRMIVVHGPQEDAQMEEREEFYEDLKAEVERSVASGNKMMISGDFNAKLEMADGEVEGVTTNGTLLKRCG